MTAPFLVSLEGNWDATINARRTALAAAAFRESNADFIIVSGTHEPGAPAHDRMRLRKLGERNTAALHEVHGIDPAFIIPGFALPFEFTYTTIAAFGNACIIGWLMSGLQRLPDPAPVAFAPISSGAHCQRVHVLNVRACQALTRFNVETTVMQQQPCHDEPHMVATEASKLKELTRNGGTVATGRWLHGNEHRSFHDPQRMRATIAHLLCAVLAEPAASQLQEIAGAVSVAQRHVLMQMLCEFSLCKQLESRALERIFARSAARFGDAIDATAASAIAQSMQA
jgi:hypothetical protein